MVMHTLDLDLRFLFLVPADPKISSLVNSNIATSQNIITCARGERDIGPLCAYWNFGRANKIAEHIIRVDFIT